MNEIHGNTANERVTQISTSLKAQSNVITELQQLIVSLEERLQPVLSPPVPCDPLGEAEQINDKAPLANDINCCTYILNVCFKQLRQIYDRTEL